jgi:hypothetical protein
VEGKELGWEEGIILGWLGNLRVVNLDYWRVELMVDWLVACWELLMVDWMATKMVGYSAGNSVDSLEQKWADWLEHLKADYWVDWLESHLVEKKGVQLAEYSGIRLVDCSVGHSVDRRASYSENHLVGESVVQREEKSVVRKVG